MKSPRSWASLTLALCFLLSTLECHAKVLELSDRFIPMRKEGMWLIKVRSGFHILDNYDLMHDMFV